MKRLGEGALPPSLPFCEALPDPVLPAVNPDALDDATFAYITAVQLPFEQLRQAAGQIAGVLVLAVTTKQGTAGHPMLDLADTARQAAADAVLGRQPPPRGAHHHRHLVLAVRAIAAAIDAARLNRRGSDDTGTDAVLTPLRAGYQELQWAAAVLPGFETVAFSQGCCARHGAAPPPGIIRATA